MYYKDFKGNKISALGLGSLRLPTIPGDTTKIDRAPAMEVIDQAFASGINYFDTAFTYHKTDSEQFLGEALSPGQLLPGIQVLRGGADRPGTCI